MADGPLAPSPFEVNYDESSDDESFMLHEEESSTSDELSEFDDQINPTTGENSENSEENIPESSSSAANPSRRANTKSKLDAKPHQPERERIERDREARPYSINWLIAGLFILVAIMRCIIGQLPCEMVRCACSRYVVPKKTFNDIELFGPMSVIPAGRFTIEKLIFFYRESILGERGETVNKNLSNLQRGVVSFLGENKESNWWISLEEEPKDIDCNILDLNKDGVKDCLVVGKNNLFKALDSETGKKLWDFCGEEAEVLKECEFDFPTALRDVDGDGVGEILAVCRVNNGGADSLWRNYFVLISGRTGTSIGSPKEMKNCYHIRNVTIESGQIIFYGCSDSSNKESANSIPFRDFVPSVKPSTLEKLLLDDTGFPLPQHKNNDGNTFYLDGRVLRVENNGQCPESCTMILKIDDERKEDDIQTLWVMEKDNSYGMIPSPLKYGNFTAFLFKYWSWDLDKTELQKASSETSQRYPKSEKGVEKESSSENLDGEKSLEDDVLQCDDDEINKLKKTIPGELVNPEQLKFFLKENLSLYRITEKIVLIIFNDNEVHINNLTQGWILQLCLNASFCQPDAHLQRQSLTMTDMYSTGFENSVSYFTTFVYKLHPKSASVHDGSLRLESGYYTAETERDIAKEYLKVTKNYHPASYQIVVNI